jgi:hypothetical protein
VCTLKAGLLVWWQLHVPLPDGRTADSKRDIIQGLLVNQPFDIHQDLTPAKTQQVAQWLKNGAPAAASITSEDVPTGDVVICPCIRHSHQRKMLING